MMPAAQPTSVAVRRAPSQQALNRLAGIEDNRRRYDASWRSMPATSTTIFRRYSSGMTDSSPPRASPAPGWLPGGLPLRSPDRFTTATLSPVRPTVSTRACATGSSPRLEGAR